MTDVPSEQEAVRPKNTGWSEPKVFLLPLALLVVAGFLWHAASEPDTPKVHQKRVGRTDYPANWPLTITDGTLWCDSDGEVSITVQNVGDAYGLNGSARADALNKPIDLIWADDPHAPGLKMSLAPLIADAEKLC